jgi:hypothetical protein
VGLQPAPSSRWLRLAALWAILGLVIGLDGNLLVSDGQTNQVKRYDSATGAFIDVFASTNLTGPSGMTIHQGVLYVTNSNPPQGVQSFDAATGVNTGNFVPSLTNPHPRDVKVNPRQQPLRRHSERRQCDALQLSNRDIHGLFRS